MIKIIVGTTNKAKMQQIKWALAPLPVEVESLPTDVVLPEIIEDGVTAQANARKKALVYSKVLNHLALSLDIALYLDDLAADKQPGITVRRIPGFEQKRPSDEDMIKYYSDLIGTLGERTTGRWEFAICVAEPDGKIHETTIIAPRIFVKTPCDRIVPGYPMESLQIDPLTKKYIANMSQAEQEEFWQRTIGRELCTFVRDNIL